MCGLFPSTFVNQYVAYIRKIHIYVCAHAYVHTYTHTHIRVPVTLFSCPRPHDHARSQISARFVFVHCHGKNLDIFRFKLCLLTRRRPTLAFSGHKDVSWKSWNEATGRAVRSLNTGSQYALQPSDSDESLESLEAYLRHRARAATSVSPSFLLVSADNGAKLIVSS